MPGLLKAGAPGAEGDCAIEPLALGPACAPRTDTAGECTLSAPGTEAARSTSLCSAPYLRSRFLCPWRRLSGCTVSIGGPRAPRPCWSRVGSTWMASGSGEREDTDVPGWRHGNASFAIWPRRPYPAALSPTSRVSKQFLRRSLRTRSMRRFHSAWVACDAHAGPFHTQLNTVCIFVNLRVRSHPGREATCRAHSSQHRRLHPSLRRSRSRPCHRPCRRPWHLPVLRRHWPARNPPAMPVSD